MQTEILQIYDDILGFRMPSAEKKKKQWQEICQRFLDAAEENNVADNKDIAKLMILEIMGGKCPKCGKDWKEIKFDNIFGQGRYYKPACKCFLQCPRCGQDLYLDDVAGNIKKNNHFCTNCRFPLSEIAENSIIKVQKTDFNKNSLKRYFEKKRRK